MYIHAVAKEEQEVSFNAVPNDFLGFSFNVDLTANEFNSSSNKWERYPSVTPKLIIICDSVDIAKLDRMFTVNKPKINAMGIEWNAPLWFVTFLKAPWAIVNTVTPAPSAISRPLRLIILPEYMVSKTVNIERTANNANTICIANPELLSMSGKIDANDVAIKAALIVKIGACDKSNKVPQ